MRCWDRLSCAGQAPFPLRARRAQVGPGRQRSACLAPVSYASLGLCGRSTSGKLSVTESSRVLGVLVADLLADDWSWQPAGEGRIRSGTASMKPTGVVKLRNGAAWIEPSYKAEHDERLIIACRDAWRPTAKTDCLTILQGAVEPMTAADVANAAGSLIGVPGDRLLSTVRTALRELVRDGAVVRPKPGRYVATSP